MSKKKSTKVILDRFDKQHWRNKWHIHNGIIDHIFRVQTSNAISLTAINSVLGTDLHR